MLQCYIDNVCRADARVALGTADFSAVAQQSDLHYVDNKCSKCDSDISTSTWTEYARGAICQLCDDVGTSDAVEYDVKPGELTGSLVKLLNLVAGHSFSKHSTYYSTIV